MKLNFLLLVTGFILLPGSAQAEDSIKKELSQSALRFFLDNSNPKTGLVRDEALNFKPTPNSLRFRRASIASTGFGLAVIANASLRNEVTKEFAFQYAKKVLQFVQQHIARRKGWFVHFVDWETGERIAQSEYSTIDTALFLAGALYAGQVFPGTEVDTMGQAIYRDVNFIDMLTDGGTKPKKLTLTMSYRDEKGYSPTQWGNYAEEMMLILLGLGSPTYPLPAQSWNAWNRQSIPIGHGEKLIGYDKPLFTHQYSQVFVDFRHFQDSFGNYYENAAEATHFNREVAKKETKFETFRRGFWGLSAGNSPDGYRAFNPIRYNGTVCLACAGASAMFLPEIVGEMEQWKTGPYGTQIWGTYGFADSINLDRDWTAEQVYGITVGPLYLALANLEKTTSVWSLFNQIPEIRVALTRASQAPVFLSQVE